MTKAVNGKFSTVGEMLDLAIRNLGVSNDVELAKRLDVRQPTISKMRTGTKMPGDATALKIASKAFLDPGRVLVCIHAEKSRSADAKAVLRRIMDSSVYHQRVTNAETPSIIHID